MEDAIGKLIEPAADTGYVCDAGVAMTWLQMTANLEPEFYPANEVMYRDLLWAFGAVRRRDGSFRFRGAGRRRPQRGRPATEVPEWTRPWRELPSLP